MQSCATGIESLQQNSQQRVHQDLESSITPHSSGAMKFLAEFNLEGAIDHDERLQVFQAATILHQVQIQGILQGSTCSKIPSHRNQRLPGSDWNSSKVFQREYRLSRWLHLSDFPPKECPARKNRRIPDTAQLPGSI